MTTESTASELRKTGISVIGDVRWGTHFCYFYETKQDLVDTLVLYFKAGLENKELCLWVVSPPLTVEEAKRALEQAVSDLDRHLAEGGLEIHGHDEWYLDNGRCDPQRVLQAWREKLSQAVARGYAGLRASGDGGWTHKDEWMVFREYEKELDALIADQHRIILCTYPLTTSPGDQVFDLACIHQVAVARRHGRWEMVETPELKQTKTELAKLKEDLEYRVVERTKEVEKSNELLNREIKDRKSAEATLKQREEYLRVLLKNVPVGVYTCNQEGLIEYYNSKAVEMWGRAPVIRDPMQKYCGSFALYHTDGTSMPFEENIMAQVVRTGIPQGNQEVVIGRPDGTRVIALVNVAPLRNERGELIGAVNCILDISGRKQAEEALRESETRFRQVAENISEVFWLSNPEAKLIHYVSPAYEKIWGRPCDSLHAEPMSWMDSIHPDDRARIAEGVRLQSVRGQHDHTYRIVRPDGSLRWIRDRAFPVRDEAGKLIRVAGLAEDITERKEAEERLRRSEEKFKALFGIAPVGISVLDGRHNIVDANPALEQIMRLSKEELLNGTYRRRTYLNADGTPRPANELASARAITENRPLNDVETGIVTENGEIIWTQVSVAPLALPDASAVVITQDITERKLAEQAMRESETRFRQVAENISEVFWLSNPEATLLHYISPAYEKIWGRSCDSLYAEPNSWMDSIHPDDRERIAEAERLQLVSGQHDHTYRIVRPDGSLRWIRDRAFPVRDESGKLIRVAGIAEDITERKEAVEQLEQHTHLLQSFSRRLFEVQEEERRHLARELHDEIGQALTAAKINLQSVTGNGGSANFARVQETTAILDRLLGQVRQIALDLRPSMLDELGLVPALRSLLDKQGRRASVAVHFSAENVPENLDPEIQTTFFRIGQEAITNAVRHADATQIDLDLWSEKKELRLRIRDNGVGFDAESAQAQTVGLGLIGMKERAALVGGRAKIASSPIKGTTIEVSLPLRFRPEQ